MSIHPYAWEKSLIERALVPHLLHKRKNAAPKPDRGYIAPAHAECENITRKNSRSFYLASGYLPKEKRIAIRSLYAFCRYTDDLVDIDDGNARYTFDDWKKRSLATALYENDFVLTAWLDTRIRHHIPTAYIEQFLDGVAMDQSKCKYENFEDLAYYCYGVASTVGLMSMSIIGFSSTDAIPYAVRLGVALQMTNILRDVAEDWERERLYLPKNELDAFGLSHSDIETGIRTGSYDDNWRAFMRYQIRRTRNLYKEAWPGIAMLNPEGRFAIAAAAEMYSGILDDIEAHDYDVFTRRAHLSDWKKLARLPGIFRSVRKLPRWHESQVN